MIKFKAKNAAGEIVNSALSPFTFPAGEAHTKREERRNLEAVEIAVITPSANSIHDDLFQLAMWVNYIEEFKYETGREIRVIVLLPYFPGARADRGTPFGLHVYAEFLRRLMVDEIVVFDPHSDALFEQLLPQYSQPALIGYNASDLFSLPHVRSQLPEYTAVIAPDKGAVRRATSVANVLGVPVFEAEKIRDFETGKISSVTLKNFTGATDKDQFLVVDDICDGGGTFAALAEHSGIPKDQIDLYVSHGVFSGAAAQVLPKHYRNIYTTNSYIDNGMLWGVKRFDVIRPMLNLIDFK